MKRTAPFLIFLALLAVLSGWLLSGINLIGRIGINTIHREYGFLKVWWKGAALLFIVWAILFGLQGLAARKLSKGSSRAVQVICLLLAVGGLYFTYVDFRKDFTHRIIGERFHLGAYLFWAGWMSISMFYLFIPDRGNKATATR